MVLLPKCLRGRIAGPARETIIDGRKGAVAEAAFLFEAPFGLIAVREHDAPNTVPKRRSDANTEYDKKSEVKPSRRDGPDIK